jgi:DNA-binding Lrp family transcriptional regulator
MKHKLEKEGCIKEYTIVPDFLKLGFQLVSFILVKIRAGLSPEETEKARQVSVRDMMEKASDEVVFLDTGIGDGYTGIVVSVHKSYADYTRLVGMLKEYPFVDTSATLSFIVDLNHKNQFRSFTLSTLARHMLTKVK